MRVLLVHENFPGQFKHLGPALVARGDQVVALGMRDLDDTLVPNGDGSPSLWGMRYVRSQGRCNTTDSGHPWSRDFDSKVIRAEAPGDEVITLVNRNLEPMRGYHRFMRALPALLSQRSSAHVVLIDGDEVSYGPRPSSGTWKQRFFDEVKADLDLSRVHFAGKVPYNVYLNILRLSSLHVCLTYSFVASWSLLETMAVGVLIVASDTAPVREFVSHGENGLLVDCFDGEGLVEAAVRLLADRALAARLGAAARARAVSDYDMTTRCLPQQRAWINAVVRG